MKTAIFLSVTLNLNQWPWYLNWKESLPPPYHKWSFYANSLKSCSLDRGTQTDRHTDKRKYYLQNYLYLIICNWFRNCSYSFTTSPLVSSHISITSVNWCRIQRANWIVLLSEVKVFPIQIFLSIDTIICDKVNKHIRQLLFSGIHLLSRWRPRFNFPIGGFFISIILPANLYRKIRIGENLISCSVTSLFWSCIYFWKFLIWQFENGEELRNPFCLKSLRRHVCWPESFSFMKLRWVILVCS